MCGCVLSSQFFSCCRIGSLFCCLIFRRMVYGTVDGVIPINIQIVESANAALAGRTLRLEVLTREREEQAARRQELFGERDPGAEEQGLPTNGRRCPCWRGAYNAEDKLKSWAPVCGLPAAIPLRPASRSSLMLSTRWARTSCAVAGSSGLRRLTSSTSRSNCCHS